MMRWQVTWQFTSHMEMKRKSVVEAPSEVAARRKIERDHIDPHSATRKELEILRVEPHVIPRRRLT